MGNVSQNPYDAATKFIQDNEAPITYLEQVANFIIQNTQGATIGQSQAQQGGSDPWGSENRYRPDQPSTPSVPAPPPKSLPQKEYLSILVARVPTIQKKIGELSQALVAGGQKDLGLSPSATEPRRPRATFKMAEYKISAILAEHDDDVRGVAFPSSKAVLSASRDGTVRLWKLLSDNPPLYDGTISSHAGSWMNTVAYLKPSADFPDGLIISSGKDVVIDVRQPTKAAEEDAEALLLGHSRDVCALDIDSSGKYIVSGSWDHDARVFPVGKWECSAVLRGHEGTVWAVLAYDDDTIVTGCADQKIRIFNKSGKLLQSFQASNSPVRALCRLPKGHPSGGDFASADNDGAIRLWKISGQQVGELRGHESFIYSLAVLPSGELVSSGEDRTLRVWKGNQCIQTITHPAISVWSVAVCTENGDIVSGASDRIVRVFTRDPERFADAETTAQFDEAVKASSIPQQTLDVNKENMPGPEFLTQKSGTQDGQIVTIRELDGSVTAHSWSSGQREWTLVGTVVDAVGSSGKKTEYNGKEYDFVFDVDMEDGKPPLKLPYNVSQNPYDAATKFIQDNEAPITYLEQVANFIIQ